MLSQLEYRAKLEKECEEFSKIILEILSKRDPNDILCRYSDGQPPRSVQKMMDQIIIHNLEGMQWVSDLVEITDRFLKRNNKEITLESRTEVFNLFLKRKG